MLSQYITGTCCKNRIDASLRKAKRWGLTTLDVYFDSLGRSADQTLFAKVMKTGHCLHRLLPRDVTRPQPHEAEAEATTHEAEAEAEATTHEAEAEATTHEAEAEAEATTHEATRGRGQDPSRDSYYFYRI